MKIVTRYILREHIGPLVFALSALTSLMLLNFVAKRFGELVGKGLPWSVIMEFVVLSLPFTLAMTLPMAVLLATLHAFSRFAAENEITAFKASGVSMHLLVRPVIVGSVLLTFFMIWFNDQVLPRANHRLATLQSDIARVKPTLALNEQVINEVLRGQLYLRAARIDATTDNMRDVVIYDLSDPTRRRTIFADSGRLAFSATGEDLVLILHQGTMNEINPSEPEKLQRNFFTTDLLKVRGVAARLERENRGDVYKSDRELGVCEMIERVKRTERDRAGAWARLREAEADGKRAPEPPPVSRGMGGLYCRGLEFVKGLFSVKEATAASLPMKGVASAQEPAPQSAAADSVDNVQRRTREVLLEGLRLELRSTQIGIDQYRVEIEKKFSIAFACIVFALLGAPIALRFPNGGVGLTISVSFAVFGIYYVGLLGGEALADRNLLDPAIAMWTTNVLLGAVGVYLTLRLGSEGSTSRGSEFGEWLGRMKDRYFTRKSA